MKLTPVVSAGQQGVSAGGANTRRTVSIGEANTLAGELVQIGGGDFGFRILTGQIAVAHVVGVDDDDVG